MKLYDDNGYPNTGLWYISQYPIVLIWGARSIGKTISALIAQTKRNEPFILLRRKQLHADLCMLPEMSPFKTVNNILNTDYTTARIEKNYGGIYHSTEKDGKTVPSGKPVGYIAALATFANVRGAGMEDVKTVIYDEYTGEKNDRAIKGEESLILNMYETINRNREIDEQNPQPPLRAIFLSNSNEFLNPVFSAFNVVDIAEKMIINKKTVVELPERGIILINYLNSPISEKKANTALYRATNNKEFKKMAIENDFNFDTNVKIKPQNIAHAKPIAEFSDFFTIYENNGIYIDLRRSGSPVTFSNNADGVKQFCRKFPKIYFQILKGNCCYQNYQVYNYVKKTLI